MGKVVNGTVVTETLAEARVIAGQRRLWLVLLGAGLVIGLAGPFGTYDSLPALPRIGYWLVVVATTFWLGYLVSFATSSWMEDRGFGSPISIGVGAVAASVPLTLFLAGLHWIIFAAPFWAETLRLFPYVAAIAIAVAAFSEALQAREAGPPAPAASPPEPAWLDRLPAHLGRGLISLQAEDHYVRARTELGEALIRTRLQDAANDLGEFGIRVHRSWWVARNAIHAYRYRNGLPVIVLHDGRALPVGRTYRRSVREALR